MRRKLGQAGVHDGWKRKRQRGPLPPTRSVIFLDNTAMGGLAKMVQEAEHEAGETTGYRVRVAEAAGTPLSMIFPYTNPWGLQDCRRPDCIP